jgi:hypothetical protein
MNIYQVKIKVLILMMILMISYKINHKEILLIRIYSVILQDNHLFQVIYVII